MKIAKQECINQNWRCLPMKIIPMLCMALYSSLALSKPFIFPAIVSVESHSLEQSFIGSKSIKSVGLRGEPSLAGFIKASIRTPQSHIKGSVYNTLVLTKVSDDGKHARYSQRFQGYEVFGGEVIAHLDRKSVSLDRVTGNFITGLEEASIATKASLKAAQAIELAKSDMDDSHDWSYQKEEADLVIYHNPNREGFQPALAYIVNFLAMSGSTDPTRPFIVIDAKTGSTIDRWEGLNT